MSDEPNKWMPANVAIGRAAAIVADDRGRATLSLREMARVGHVHSRARSLDRPGCNPEENSDLPASFWAPPRGLLANAAWPVPLEDWEHGEFEGGGTVFGPWKAHGVEFLRVDIDRHYPERPPQRSLSASRPKRGRRTGVGGYAQSDRPLVAEMHGLIVSGRATSIHNAAVQLASMAAPETSSPETRTKRLVARYKEQFPELPD